MNISIQQIRSATPDEWDQIWRECDSSTYFHSREWAEIWNLYTRGEMKPDPKLVLFSDGKRTLLPLSYQTSLKGFIKNYISSPAGTFGGWISTDDLSADHAALMRDLLNRRLGSMVWRVNPYDELQLLESNAYKQDETHTLWLEGGFEAVYKEWTKGHRSAAKQASKAGVSVKLATTMDDWYAYYEVYQDSIRRWGDKATSKYEKQLFENLFRRRSSSIKLWLAVYENTIIAGALCLYAKKHVAYWHGAALEKYFNLRPTNLLMYESIRNVCEEGYSWFDFNPSGGHEGVKAFKKSFGTRTLSCPVVRVESKFSTVAKNLLSHVGV